MSLIRTSGDQSWNGFVQKYPVTPHQTGVFWTPDGESYMYIVHAKFFKKTLHFLRNRHFYLFRGGFIWGLYGGGLTGKCQSFAHNLNLWPSRHTPQQFSQKVQGTDHLLCAFWTAGFTARPPDIGSVRCNGIFQGQNRTIGCIVDSSKGVFGRVSAFCVHPCGFCLENLNIGETLGGKFCSVLIRDTILVRCGYSSTKFSTTSKFSECDLHIFKTTSSRCWINWDSSVGRVHDCKSEGWWFQSRQKPFDKTRGQYSCRSTYHTTLNLEQLCTLIMTQVCVLNLVQPFYF
jgi:hypothetical protein